MTQTKTITDTPVDWLPIPPTRRRATCKSESAVTVATVPVATACRRKEVSHAQSH
jgi:hypothetical protein